MLTLEQSNKTVLYSVDLFSTYVSLRACGPNLALCKLGVVCMVLHHVHTPDIKESASTLQREVDPEGEQFQRPVHSFATRQSLFSRIICTVTWKLHTKASQSASRLQQSALLQARSQNDGAVRAIFIKTEDKAKWLLETVKLIWKIWIQFHGWAIKKECAETRLNIHHFAFASGFVWFC